MRNTGLAAFSLLILLFIMTGCGTHEQDKTPTAVQGTIDARGWNFEHDGPLKLRGEWAFYWQRLLEPDQLAATGTPSYIAVPGSWNEFVMDGRKLPDKGYATYVLRILTSESGQVRALSVPEASRAYKLWVNGKPVGANGIVADSRDRYNPQSKPEIVPFPIESDTIEIVVQVANFDHRFGGLWRDIEYGPEASFIHKEGWATALDLFVFGSLGFMGLYHLGLFLYRPKEPSLIFFGISCLLIAIRTLVVGQKYMLELFPNFDWAISSKIGYETYYLLVPLSVMFVRALYPAEMPRIAVRIVQAIGFGFGIYAWIATPYIVSKTNFVYQVFSIAVIVYASYVLYLTVRRRREGSLLILAGSLCVSLTVIWDILYYNEIVKFGDVTPLGLFAISLTQSFVLASRFSRAFTRVEQLSHELTNLNRNLERTVEARTADIRKMEASRRTLLNNISHDLNTPIMLIQGYVEALSSGLVKEEAERSKYLRMTRSRIDGLNRLIHDLFELAKLEDRQIDMHLQPLTIGEFIRHFTAKYEMEVTDSGYRFESSLSPAVRKNTHQELNVDMDRIEQVLTNMVYNALTHSGAEQGVITFLFEHTTHSPNAEFTMSVIDNGVGISEDDLPHVFERLHQSGRTSGGRQGHSGLGLAIAKEIVEMHHGRIGVESKRNEGSRFWFSLPLDKI